LISKAPDDPASNTQHAEKLGGLQQRKKTVTQDIYRTSPLPPLSHFCFLFFAVVTTCNLLL
jgi:hypothetical protein